MYNYGQLELLILSCMMIKPKLLETTKLEVKHFKHSSKIFILFNSFYKKFGTLDCELMCKMVDNKYKYIDYIKVLSELEPTASNFEKYENLLLELYQEQIDEKIFKSKVFNLANDLYVGNITCKDFTDKINKFYENIKKDFT